MLERQLVARGIRDRRVLDAMATVPRERFVPENSRADAYADCPVAIGRGQTISQPYMVGRMLEVLDCRSDHVALEVGAGSGYQAALLGELSAEVWAVEIVEVLAERARRVLGELGYDSVHVVVGDGTEGLPEHGPYDRIIVAAGAPSVPEPLVEQLADGGRLVMPVGSRMAQRLVTVDRDGDEFRRTEGMSCVFVPLLGRHGWRPDG
ncbi:MAG: protein-L-isoaspartate(D-aspartate) O-methyltransferase [Armatimonadota bacterium]|jgi:protein-L-isoaspartate(D-aspartate) O-methyltransferase